MEEKGDNQNQVSLGLDSYLPLGHFCLCGQENERVTLSIEGESRGGIC